MEISEYRQFMLVNGDGSLVSGRSHSKTVLITGYLKGVNTLVLSAPDMPEFQVPFPSKDGSRSPAWKEKQCM